MTTQNARRVLTEMRDGCEEQRLMNLANGFGISPEYQAMIDALAYALEQVWIPQDVAQAALPLVEDARDVAKLVDGFAPRESQFSTWQALADALKGGK